MAYNSQYTGPAFDKGMKQALTVGDVDDLETNDRTTVVNAINEVKRNAEDAEGAAVKAERFLEQVKEEMTKLPDAQGVSAKVAENAANILELLGQQTLITFDEYKAIPKQSKEMRYYFVAKTEEDVMKYKIWRVYLRHKPIFEFDDNGIVTNVFPRMFPHMFG